MNRTIAIVTLVAASATASDLTGKWSGTFKVDGGDHTVPQLFILKQQGKTLSGSGGPNASEQYPIENGRIDGDEARFELTTGEWKFAYDLRQTTPGALNGTLKLQSVNDSRNATVSLTRSRGN
jgi:hypothetical protein